MAGTSTRVEVTAPGMEAVATGFGVEDSPPTTESTDRDVV